MPHRITGGSLRVAALAALTQWARCTTGCTPAGSRWKQRTGRATRRTRGGTLGSDPRRVRFLFDEQRWPSSHPRRACHGAGEAPGTVGEPTALCSKGAGVAPRRAPRGAPGGSARLALARAGCAARRTGSAAHTETRFHPCSATPPAQDMASEALADPGSLLPSAWLQWGQRTPHAGSPRLAPCGRFCSRAARVTLAVRRWGHRQSTAHWRAVPHVSSLVKLRRDKNHCVKHWQQSAAHCELVVQDSTTAVSVPSLAVDLRRTLRTSGNSITGFGTNGHRGGVGH